MLSLTCLTTTLHVNIRQAVFMRMKCTCSVCPLYVMSDVSKGTWPAVCTVWYDNDEMTHTHVETHQKCTRCLCAIQLWKSGQGQVYPLRTSNSVLELLNDVVTYDYYVMTFFLGVPIQA